MVEHLAHYLSGLFPYALHVKRSGRQAHLVRACIEEENVRTAVLGSVVFASVTEEDVAGLLAGWNSCIPSLKGPEVPVVDEVGELSARLSNSIAQSSPLVVTGMVLDW